MAALSAEAAPARVAPSAKPSALIEATVYPPPPIGATTLLENSRRAFLVSGTTATGCPVQALELFPGYDQPGGTVGEVFYEHSVSVTYAAGPAFLSSSPLGPLPLATDDRLCVRVTRPDATIWQACYDSYTNDFGPIDLSLYLQPGDNGVYIALTDLVEPRRGGSPVYLLLGGDEDPPVISEVTWRQDGAGQTIVMATITDNCAVAAAALWWNGIEYAMGLMGADRYYAIVPQEPNGIVGRFRITAVDPAGNLAYWPSGGLTQEERIRYTKWAGLRANTRLAGDPVNTAIGSFYTQHLDIRAPGPGMSFEFRRTYNTVSAHLDGPLGYGWTHNYNIHLQEVDDPLLHGVVITYEDGRTANYEADGSGFRSPPGDHDTLTRDGAGFVLTRRNQTRYRFDAAGKLVAIADLNGNTLSLAYSGDNLTQITDTAGRAYHIEYAGHRLVKVTDALGRTYRYTYDGTGNLVEYTDPEAGRLLYRYDGEHWLLSITDPNGHPFVTNEYDDRGRVVTQRDASGTPSSFTYVDERHVVFTDNEGHDTHYLYDDRLRIIEERDALGYSLRYTYDADDNMATRTNRRGAVTEFTYDDRGNLLTRKNALGGIAEWRYTVLNRVEYARDEAGAETMYTYDVRGNLLSVRDAMGGLTYMTPLPNGQLASLRDANGHETQYRYDAQGNLIAEESALAQITQYQVDAMGRRLHLRDANGHEVAFEYDGNDRVIRIVDPKGNATLFEYDGVGNLLSVTDRRGYTTTYRYDRNDSLISVTNPQGHVERFGYDRLYHRTQYTNARGHITRYVYDAVYNLIETIDVKGNSTRQVYDAEHNLIQVTDALSQVTTYEYDLLDRLITVTDALNGQTRIDYDAVGRPIRKVAPNGAVTRYEYDAVGRLVVVWDAYDHVTKYDYDAVGNQILVTNARGHTTHYEYDAVNRLLRITDPLNYTQSMAYDGVGNVVAVTNARGYVTHYGYDANDNLKWVRDALDGWKRYTYDAEDRRLTATNENLRTTSYGYDDVSNLVSMTLPGGQTTAFEYDANGNVVAVVNAKDKRTEYTYDERDLLVQTKNPLGFATTNAYDALRRLIQFTDPEDHATRYSYDALGRLVQITDALNGETRYTYDAVGALTAIIDANGHQTTFAVDLLGRVLTENNPLDSAWSYVHDEVGNQIRRLDANGVLTEYVWDENQRLARIVYPSAPEVQFAYDPNGNLTAVEDGTGRQEFTYNALDRMGEARRTAGILAGVALRYSYDAAGNCRSITYPDGKVVRYGYDINEWLTSIIDPLGGTTSTSYDPVGLPTSVRYPNGTWTTYTYDDADRLTALFNGKPDTSNNLISSYRFEMDKVGNRTRVVERVSRGQVVTWDKRYAYDALYRLLSAVETPDRRPYQVLTSQFTYDAVGNRLSMATNIADAPNTPALPGMVTTVYSYNAANQMLTAGDARFTYDRNGNRVEMVAPNRAIQHAYDVENRLAGASTYNIQPNGKWQPETALDFAYDGLGRRVQRGVVDRGVRKTASFLYDALGYDLLAQVVDPGSPAATYYYRDAQRVLSRHETQGKGRGLQYFHHYDALGNVAAWTNQAGKAVQEYRYTPYGRLLDNNGPDNASNKTDPHNVLTWSGKPWDRVLETYYYGAREYDPAAGVWLTQDPYRGRQSLPASQHRYLYVHGNPVNYSDRVGYAVEFKDGYLVLPYEIPINGKSLLTSYGLSPQLMPVQSASSQAAVMRGKVIAQGKSSGATLKSLNGGTKEASLSLHSGIVDPAKYVGIDFEFPLGETILPGLVWDWHLTRSVSVGARVDPDAEFTVYPDGKVKIGNLEVNVLDESLGFVTPVFELKSDGILVVKWEREVKAGGLAIDVSTQLKIKQVHNPKFVQILLATGEAITVTVEKVREMTPYLVVLAAILISGTPAIL